MWYSYHYFEFYDLWMLSRAVILFSLVIFLALKKFFFSFASIEQCVLAIEFISISISTNPHNFINIYILMCQIFPECGITLTRHLNATYIKVTSTLFWWKKISIFNALLLFMHIYIFNSAYSHAYMLNIPCLIFNIWVEAL